MAHISVKQWWKAREIPLVETKWRHIKLYRDNEVDISNWSRCVYFIRLAPPFQIAYGENDNSNSPLIYIGKGAIRQRWIHHCKEWIGPLGDLLPGARYEVWAFQHDLCEEIESDALRLFQQGYNRLPLANRIGGVGRQKHTYDESLYQVAGVDERDHRYWWALRPTQADVKEYFEKGALPSENDEQA